MCQASWLNFHFQETPGFEASYQGHMAEAAGRSMPCSFDRRSRAHSHLLLWVPAGSWTVPSAYKVGQQISCWCNLEFPQQHLSFTPFASLKEILNFVTSYLSFYFYPPIACQDGAYTETYKLSHWMAQQALKEKEGLALGFPKPSPEALGWVTWKELKMWAKIRL